MTNTSLSMKTTMNNISNKTAKKPGTLLIGRVFNMSRKDYFFSFLPLRVETIKARARSTMMPPKIQLITENSM